MHTSRFLGLSVVGSLALTACVLPVDDGASEDQLAGVDEELVAGQFARCPACSGLSSDSSGDAIDWSYVPPVSQLRFTYDPSVCAAHAGVDFLGFSYWLCQEAIVQGDAILVWDYPESVSIDHFRVSYSRRGWPEVELEQRAPDLTMMALPSTPGACYIVQAVRGSVVSAAVRACVPRTGAPTPQTLTLTPSAVLTRFDGETAGPALESFDDDAQRLYETAPPDVSAGVTHHWNHPIWPLPDSWAWASARGAFRFDLGAVEGKYILSAELSMTEGVHSSSDANGVRCQIALQSAAQNFMTSAELPPGNDFAMLPNASAHVVDVTNLARAWANAPETSFGFVLKAAGEGRRDSSDHCKSTFSGMQLKVTFMR